MANVTIDKATGLIQIRAYAGRDKRTKKANNLYISLPAGSTPEEIEEAKQRLDARAAEYKKMGFSTDVVSMFARYFDVCRAAGYAPSTVQSYVSDFRCHVEPYIGASSVVDLRPWVMSEMFMELAASGKVDDTPLSQNSMAKLYSWLNAAFKWMVGEGHIATNPMEGCKHIYPSHVEAEPINEFDLKKIYAWLIQDWTSWDELSFKRIIWLDLGTGMRRGEIAGLQVADLRTAAGDIAVSRSLTEAGGLHYKSPKSKTSVRRISIDPGVASELTAYLLDQRNMLEEVGIEQKADTPLFCHEDGSPWRPSELTLGFGQLRRDLGLSAGVHFHSMRHTHASQLLASGTDIRTLQERLGHASVNTTLRIYGHVLPGRDRAAAESWASFEQGLRGGEK